MTKPTVKELQQHVDKMVASADEIGLGFSEFWKGVVNSKRAFAKKIKSQKKGTYIEGSEYMMRVCEIQHDDLRLLIKEERRRGRKARREKGKDKEVDKTTALTQDLRNKLKDLRSLLTDEHKVLVHNDNQQFKKLLAKEEAMYDGFLTILHGLNRELQLLLKEEITAKNAKSIANGFANIALGMVSAGLLSACSTSATATTSASLVSSLAQLEAASKTFLAALAVVPGGAATLIVLLSALLVVIVRIRKVKQRAKAKVAAARKAAAKEEGELARKDHLGQVEKENLLKKIAKDFWKLKPTWEYFGKRYPDYANKSHGKPRHISGHLTSEAIKEIQHDLPRGAEIITGSVVTMAWTARGSTPTSKNVRYVQEPNQRIAGDYLGGIEKSYTQHGSEWADRYRCYIYVVPYIDDGEVWWKSYLWQPNFWKKLTVGNKSKEITDFRYIDKSERVGYSLPSGGKFSLLKWYPSRY